MEPRDMTWNGVDAVQLLEACMQMEHVEDDPTTFTVWDVDGHSLGDPGGVALGGGLCPLDAWDYAW